MAAYLQRTGLRRTRPVDPTSRRHTLDRPALGARPDWKEKAEADGFTFHTMYGEPYWDEETVYAFTLEEIETRIEDASTDLHAMCREAAGHIVESEELLAKLDIPEAHWDLVRNSWRAGEGELYGRFDLIYDGTGPASMIEYNADTPTSLYESASFQWKWFEDQRDRGVLPEGADQFNRIYEALSERFAALFAPDTTVHFTSVGGEASREDFSTVEFLAYAARDAGLGAQYVEIGQIGLTTEGQFADAEARVIGALFKLYPWEDMLRDDFATAIAGAQCRFLEPAWKAVVSNKGLLPVLWEMFEGHPNLLPSFFSEDVAGPSEAVRRASDRGLFAQGRVTKPIFSREGASVTISGPDDAVIAAAGNRAYDANRTIVQAYRPLPDFDGFHPVLGSWIVGDTCVGLGVREDRDRITQDLSRFKPHFILD
jgi:glutathionylspermidine synthase